MKKYIIILFIGFAFLGQAQERTQVIVSYLPALTLGETNDFAKNLSPRGVDLEVNYLVSEDVSVGFLVGWNVFRDKIAGESFTYQDVLITGTQFRYLNVTPLNLNVKKYFMQGETQPYVGLGLGTSFAKKRNEFGVYTITDERWLFNFAPEVGVHLEWGRGILAFKLKYNYNVKAKDFGSVSYLSLGLGIGFD